MSGKRFAIDGKLAGDTAWNYGAFALTAATGVILNFFIAAGFGIETLGVFNQIYAIYIVTSQLAVYGIHDSAQKYTAEHAADADARRAVARTAVLIAAGFGLAVAAAIYFSSELIGRIADSRPVGLGIALAAPGLLFFALNKVLMGILNGERRMRAFAVAQGVRALAILGFCFAVAVAEQPGYVLGASFTFAEVILLAPLMFSVRPWRRGGRAAPATRDWLRKHLDFGTRALANGFLAESYIRIDIIMLAVFVGDAEIGIYSFAAMFIEGLYQVSVVIRTVVNPVLVRLILDGEQLQLARFGRRVMAAGLAVFAVVAGCVLLVFPELARFFPDGLVSGAYPVLVVLITGLAVYAAFIPLDFILLQGGMPGRQSGLMTLNVTLNVGLNLGLIPLYGIEGAAIATAISFAISGLTLNLAAWRWLSMPGGLLFAGTVIAPLKNHPHR